MLQRKAQMSVGALSETAASDVLMLVPHEPSLDPRVQYTAASLATRYKLRVMSVVRPSEKRPERNITGDMTYETIRLNHDDRGSAAIAMQFAAFIFGRSIERPFDRRAQIAWKSLCILFSVVALPVALTITIAELLILPFAAAKRGRNVLKSPALTILPAAARKLYRVSSVFPRPSKPADHRLSIVLSMFRFIFEVNGTLQAYLQSADLAPRLVYCHDLYTLQTAVALKRKVGCKIIYDSHEYYPDQHADRFFAFLVRFYESSLVRSVDVYITVSPQLASELQRLYKVSHVYALPNVEPRPPEAVQPLETGMAVHAGQRLKVLYQGAFAQDRGLEEVLREWRDVNAGKAVLFLRGPKNEARDQLELLAKENGLLGSSVFILAPVLEADLIAGAAEADVGLIPYKTDRLAYRFACPNKLSQYIHAGIAVVANRIPFVETLIEDAKAGLCYDTSTRGSLARAINALASDQKLLASLRAGSRALSATNYNWESYEAMLLHLCAQLEGK